MVVPTGIEPVTLSRQDKVIPFHQGTINKRMKVGDRIRIIQKTMDHDIGDIGTITGIDYRIQHCIIVEFPNQHYKSLFRINGHQASLLVKTGLENLYEVID